MKIGVGGFRKAEYTILYAILSYLIGIISTKKGPTFVHATETIVKYYSNLSNITLYIKMVFWKLILDLKS